MSEVGNAGESRPTGRVAFAQAILDQPGLDHDGDAGALRLSLVPGTEDIRYNKLWRLGQVTWGDSEAFGRLGFERTSLTTTDVWDAESLDFVESEYPTGAVSPFVVRLSDLVIGFQLRGNDIDVGSFTYALAAILSKASDLNWRVIPLRREISFDEWARDVAVTSLTANLRRPNPDYKDRPSVRDFLEGPGAESGEVRWKAADGGALNIEDRLIQEYIEHAERRHYGRVSARGKRGVREVAYSDGGEDMTIAVSADPETGDVGLEILSQVVGSATEDGAAGR